MGSSAVLETPPVHPSSARNRKAAKNKGSTAPESEARISRELSLSEWAHPDKESPTSTLTEAPSTSGEEELETKTGWVNSVLSYLANSNQKKRERRAKLHKDGLLRIAADTLTFWQKIWHYVFLDPYERVNVWSHGLGALFFFCYATWGHVGWLFPLCAATTHLLSVGAHIYPGSLVTEKLDHLGIVFLIVGTPLSIDEALGWRLGGRVYAKFIVPAIGSASILPDEPRVAGFVAGGAALLAVYQHLLWEVIMLAELCLYLGVAFLFLKGGNHHWSKWALADHHIAHYCVTAASLLHLAWLHHIRHQTVEDGYGSLTT